MSKKHVSLAAALTLAAIAAAFPPRADARRGAELNRPTPVGFSAMLGGAGRAPTQTLPVPGAPDVTTRSPLRVQVACEGLPMTVCRRHGLTFGRPLLPRSSKDTPELAPPPTR